MGGHRFALHQLHYQVVWPDVVKRADVGVVERGKRAGFADEFTPGRTPYQFRRLGRPGLMERIPTTHRYRLTGFGSVSRSFAHAPTPGFYGPSRPPAAGHILPSMSVAAQFR